MMCRTGFGSKLQKVIPSIKRLNGHDLPETIHFAIENDSKTTTTDAKKPLPESVLGWFPNDEVKIALLTFLKTYFTRYDSKPRGESLLPYYTSSSQFVLSVAPESRGMHGHSVSARIDEPNGNKIYLNTSRITGAYIQRSRNLLRCRDEIRRRDLVIKGSLSIASLLDELPSTEHPLESFSVDVAFHSPTQILFTVSGVFYEVSPINVNRNNSATSNDCPTNSIRKILRCFTRTMILVAPGGHVIQDDFIISNPSTALCKKYIHEVASRAKAQQVNNNPAPSVPTVATGALALTMDNVVNEFSQRTKMNLSFSKQCLEEYSWDVNAAWTAFEAMNAAGKIPSIAFV